MNDVTSSVKSVSISITEIRNLCYFAAIFLRQEEIYNKKNKRKMDMSYRIMILALLIGLASAQINFSTSWGKRSSSAIPVAPGLSLSALRQQLHPRRETIGTSQQQQQLQNIAETYSGSASPYSDVEDQRTVPLPSPCLSLLKSLLMVNQIVEVGPSSSNLLLLLSRLHFSFCLLVVTC